MHVDNGTTKVRSIEIYGMLGNMVMEREINGTKFEINVENLTQGEYTLQLIFENRVKTKEE